MFQARNAGASQASFQPRKRRIGVVVMAREPRAQVARLDRRARARAMLATETSSTKRCGATATTPATGWRAACSSAIEPPSLWPKSQGRSMPSAASSARQHLVGLARA